MVRHATRVRAERGPEAEGAVGAVEAAEPREPEGQDAQARVPAPRPATQHTHTHTHKQTRAREKARIPLRFDPRARGGDGGGRKSGTDESCQRPRGVGGAAVRREPAAFLLAGRRGALPAAGVGSLRVGKEGRQEWAGAAAGEAEEAAADGVVAVARVEPVEGRAAAAGLVCHAREGLDRLRRRRCRGSAVGGGGRRSQPCGAATTERNRSRCCARRALPATGCAMPGNEDTCSRR